MVVVPYENITRPAELIDYCRELSHAEVIGFDTEFVAEDTYRPILCLIQVTADHRLALIDPLELEDLTPFWEALAAPGHVTVVHSGRGEAEFGLQAIERFPAALFDVQIASGLVSGEFPSGYAALSARWVGHAPSKHETRTDWRRRPLARRQLDYAVDDVRYLLPIYERVRARLEELGRMAWMEQEMLHWQEDLRRSQQEERWRRMAAQPGLDLVSQAIVRELWQWRQAEAELTNKPLRRILRDDLILELARRRTADPKRIQAVRGMNWTSVRRYLPEVARRIQQGIDQPEPPTPSPQRRESLPQMTLLAQFLAAALASLCRQHQIAPALVGGPGEVREYLTYRLARGRVWQEAPPPLARGWRAEFVGTLFDELLAGNVGLRITDPWSEHPLALEKLEEAGKEGRKPNPE